MPTFLFWGLLTIKTKKIFFNKLNTFYVFCKNSFRNSIRMSNILDADQEWLSIGSDLGPNCLQGYQHTTLSVW